MKVSLLHVQQAVGGLQLGAQLVAQEVQVHPLAGGQDDGVGVDDGAVVLVVNGAEAALLVVDGNALLRFKSGGFAVLLDDAGKAAAVDDHDALFPGAGDLFLGGGHLRFLLQAAEGDFLRAQAHSGQGHVHGHVAAAADQDVLAESGDFLEVCIDFHQEIEAELGQFSPWMPRTGCFHAPVPMKTLS